MKLLTSFILGLLLGFGSITGMQSSTTEAETDARSYFLDAEQGSYYNNSLLETVHKGIISGYADGRFGPHDAVTRGQIAVILMRYHHNVIKPLQRKVEYLLKHLDLGECGNKIRDIGEQCDDGNQNDGDGCSSECLKEHKPESPKKKCEGGYEVDERFDAPDGCNTCFCGEDGSIGCTEMACVSECDPYICGDGSEHPRCSEDGHVINYLVDPCWASASCDRLEQDLADTFRESRACRTDDDCAVLVRGCTPYLTCGKPVNKGSLGKVKEAIAGYIKACPEEGPQACAGCVQQHVQCDEGFCRLQEIKTCPEDVKICDDGSIVSRNPSLECEFDPCPEELGEGSCIEDITGIRELVENSRGCSSNADCVQVGGCAVGYACGTSVSADVAESIDEKMNLLDEQCPDFSCVQGCTESTYVCEQGQCATKYMKCDIYSFEGVNKEYCATCGDGICDAKEGCTSSHCSGNACTDDCGPLYCPADCEE